MNKFGNIEILVPSCNLTTIDDGRGDIYLDSDDTWEFNMLYFKPGKVRGNHYHQKFTSILVTDGSGVMITKILMGKKYLIMPTKAPVLRHRQIRVMLLQL